MRWTHCIGLIALVAILCPGVGSALAEGGSHRTADGKLKVLYHVDGTDLATAKYAMALIKKHIEAEGGPDKIDIKLVVHGPALNLFRKETIDPGLLSGFKGIVEKGAEPEMCQVSMKLLNAPLETLAPGFEPTEHPVAVKRIADLQEQGYIYIKP
ncbi:MAG: DsrE family protein [Nitrospina sp.]|nr:DsrE family protein [Nitrospina sp.]